jgi:polar amino acid transport system substrate-binding protein
MVSKVRLVADPYPPYQFEENGRIRGVDNDIIKESFSVHDIEIETGLYGWDRCMEMMEAGNADGIFQITSTPERERQFLFSHQLRTACTLFFRRKRFPIELDSAVDLGSQLHNVKVGVLSGYSYGAAVDSIGDEQKVSAESGESLVFGLQRGEFALALMDQGVAACLMARLRIDTIEITPGFSIQRKLYVAFRKELFDLVRFFNSGLKTIREKGVYDDVFRRYGLQPISQTR